MWKGKRGNFLLGVTAVRATNTRYQSTLSRMLGNAKFTRQRMYDCLLLPTRISANRLSQDHQ